MHDQSMSPGATCDFEDRRLAALPRLGGGILVPVAPQLKFGAYGNYVNQQVDTSYLGVTTSGEVACALYQR